MLGKQSNDAITYTWPSVELGETPDPTAVSGHVSLLCRTYVVH
jgi:hypothetical protein